MPVRTRPSNAAAFSEKINEFALERQRRDARTTWLLKPDGDLDQSPDVLRTALDELRFQHEELLVAEEELRAQLDELTRMGLRVESERARYVDVFEHAPDAYLVTDQNGTIRDANTAASELFAIPFRFLRGKPLATLVARGETTRLHDLLAQISGTEPRAAIRAELTVSPRNAASVAVVARATLTSQEGRILWILRRVEESGDDRTIDELRRALRDKEELLVRERRVRSELEAASEAKDRFIGVLSHDLRSPLNAILGWVQLLQREVLDGTARKRAFATIERNAVAQAELIEELLDISRMAANRFHVEVVPVDLRSVVDAVVESSLPKAASEGLEIVVTTAAERREPGAPAVDDFPILGDRRRLEQVVTNLVANSLKFTPPGGRIEVSLRRDDTCVELVVRDTGRGIEETLLPRLFNLYTQDGDYKTTRNGLGLGLYIVKRLVELQYGSVRAESEGPGKGATITVTFPLRTTRSQPPSPPAPIEPSRLTGLRILVVDDEEDSRELMATVLARAGADVQCARNGAAALELHTHGTFDVLVSDLAMPGLDGCELLRRLRERDGLLVGIAVSGYATEVDTKHAFSAGFDAHIAKPADARQLVEIVKATARPAL